MARSRCLRPYRLVCRTRVLPSASLCAQRKVPENHRQAEPGRHQGEAMKLKLRWSALLCIAVTLATAAPKGTVPRAAADRYSIHAERNEVGIGVILLSPEQARRQFVSD